MPCESKGTGRIGPCFYRSVLLCSARRPTAILCDNKCFYSLDDSITKPTLHGCGIILHWAIHVASQTSATLCFPFRFFFSFFPHPFYHRNARLGCSRTTASIGRHLVYERCWQGNIVTNHFTFRSLFRLLPTAHASWPWPSAHGGLPFLRTSENAHRLSRHIS